MVLGKIGRNLIHKNSPFDAIVKYLQTSGTQCIDTGLYAVAGLGFDAYWGVTSNWNTWGTIYPFGMHNDWWSGNMTLID